MSLYLRKDERKRLVLASSSPRRLCLIKAIDPVVEVVPSNTEEEIGNLHDLPEVLVVKISSAKAREASNQLRDAIVLGADTLVSLEGKVFGKPNTIDDAIRMLKMLRGRTHSVFTGITVRDSESGRQLETFKSSEVVMRKYSDMEIENYIMSGKPFDRAGGYGIQDEAFSPVDSVKGCHLNVLGLPVCEVVGLFKRFGVDARIRPEWSPHLRCSCRRINVQVVSS